MAENNAQLSSKLAGAGAHLVPSAFRENTGAWYLQNKKQILALVAGQESKAALFIAASFAQVNKIPELLNCTPESFFSCILYAMGTNLLPGPMAECYFLPFRDGDKKNATFIPSYTGLVKLMYNGGYVTRISSHVVWEADEFDYNPADELIIHRPFRGPEKDRGERVAAYTSIKNIYGETHREVRFAEFINSIKNRSKAGNISYSPWNSKFPSDVDAMWMKTTCKQAKKWVPISSSPVSVQLARAIDLDNRADTGEAETPPILADELDSVRQLIGASEQSKNEETTK